jgi:hypothetical protein
MAGVVVAILFFPGAHHQLTVLSYVTALSSNAPLTN